jgi:uncharacterized HAD superfamily protein
MPQSNKIILTDVDGVLLDWENHFAKWMKSKGHQENANARSMYSMTDRYGMVKSEMRKFTTEFNKSAWMSTQEPMPDSQTWVKLLYAEGWTFVPITSQTLDIPAQELRKNRLRELFGNVFHNFFILDTGADKHSALAEFKDTGLYWVEDKITNAKLGIEYGLKSLLYNHSFNQDLNDEKITRVNNWKHIYQIVNDRI